MNSFLLTDGYKTGHHQQYPKGTTLVFSNFTPRADKYAPEVCKNKGVVVFGVQMVMQQIKEHFDKNFFLNDLRINMEDANGNFQKTMALRHNNDLKNSVCGEIKDELSMYLNTEYDTSHIEELWDLGYLPLEVRALDEGTICPIRVPMLTIHNTLPEFYWLPNFLETILSNLLWKPMTSATIALAYREILTKWADKTNVEGKEFVLWQGHDFSMRGLDSIDATVSSGLGHLTSFYGTDSLPTLYGARYFYDEKGFVGGSVPATEHSVMCAGSKEDELGTFKRLMQTYPKGILSVVSDTWDLWNVITNILPKLKEQILGRDGKLVIRPDSGDPVDILCGLNTRDKEVSHTHNDAEYKGVIELLWDIFGGTINSQGYKVLDSHIGAIYGDSITTERAEEICRRLESKGFASTNVVFGIGSFTYQYNTRDTFGFAMKATYVEKEVEVQVGTTPENLKWTTEIQGFEIFKDPVTDNGMKKSAKGLLRVVRNKSSNQLLLEDECSWSDVESEENQLKVVFKDGEFVKRTTLTEIRERLNEH